VAPGELGVDPLRLSVRRLERAEQVVLEPIRCGLVDLLVRLGQVPERKRDVVCGLGDGVEQLLPGFGVRVGHQRSLVPRP
jgi:hypothetical protein